MKKPILVLFSMGLVFVFFLLTATGAVAADEGFAAISAGEVLLSPAEAIPGLTGDDYMQGYLRGQQDAAEYHSATGWGIGGFAGGFLLGLLGGGGVVLASTAVDPQVDAALLARLGEVSPEYRLGYLEGFRKEAKRKNTNVALGGAAIGWVLGVLVVYSYYY